MYNGRLLFDKIHCRYLNLSRNDDCFYFTTVAYSIMNTERQAKIFSRITVAGLILCNCI